MAAGKKIKVLALALALLMVFAVLLHSRRSHDWGSSSVSAIVSEKALFDSKNNENTDAAINREISKEKTKEETGDTGADKPDLADADTLDFDPAKEFLQIRALAPMTIFSKTYCPFLKRLKKLLAESYTITPAPLIVELDKHKHGQELQDYIGRVTERSTVPNVLVGTALVISKGGADDFIALHNDGKLVEMLTLWGDREISVERREMPSNH